jgi:hypothetical protein
MIFLHGCLNLAKNASLGISFQSDVTMPTAFVLQVYKCSKFLGLMHVHRVMLSLCFIMQRVDNTEGLIVFSLNGMCLDTHLQAVDIAAFCLTKLDLIPPPCLWDFPYVYTEECMTSKWT